MPTVSSACPPGIDSGVPATRMRGPGKAPSSTASRIASEASSGPPASRTVVKPARAVISAFFRPVVAA